MDFSEARLGDQYSIFIDKEDNICNSVNSRAQIFATVIGIAKDPVRYSGKTVLLGWKPDQRHPADASKRNGTESPFINFISNAKDFVFSKMMDHRHECAGKTIQKFTTSGSTCKRCREIYPYANPNQNDGSFICYGCRMEW